MAEFQKECDEYGCLPIEVQWGRVVDMLIAQAEPKNHKKDRKIWESKWSQICIENIWDEPDKMFTPLAPKTMDMEKMSHVRLKKHQSVRNKDKWTQKGKYISQEKEYSTDLRLWTRIALTATALTFEKSTAGRDIDKDSAEKSGSVRESSERHKPFLQIISGIETVRYNYAQRLKLEA